MKHYSNRVSQSEAWTGVADCRNCAIRNSALFAGLDEAAFDTIHRPIDQISYRPGAQIYAQDDDASSIMTIRTGLVKLTQYLPDGNQRIVRLLCSTDIVGLEAMVAPRYEHTAVALHATQLCRIPVDTVRELSVARPQLCQDLMARWHLALNDADRWITEFCTGPARSRVARLLKWLAERNGGLNCELFSREDLGALLGLTTETSSRIIAEFKRQGLITESRTNVFTCDLQRLDAIYS
ncbi:MAG: Crp/Fnr family transcriptional regulator [Alphaproteobacteria bacterium]|nr:Crp/Fnr family transcriptional regulator [Alphaproteobacteria bacterium]